MSLTCLWTIHCDDCCHWETIHPRAKMTRWFARTRGWLLRPRAKGGDLCPDCRKRLANAPPPVLPLLTDDGN